MNLDTLTKAGEVPPPSPEVLARAQSAVREAVGRDVAGWSVVATKRSRRRLLVPALCAATVAVVVVVGSLLAGPSPIDSPDDPPIAGGQPTQTAPMPSYRGGNSGASCVGPPEGKWLRDQQFAFDGTVLTVEEPAAGHPLFMRQDYTVVTLQVNHWYKADRGPQVQVLLPGPTDPRHSDWTSELGLPFELGSRLLVSGKVYDGFAKPLVNWVGWSCGFSRKYDGQTARTWAETFGK